MVLKASSFLFNLSCAVLLVFNAAMFSGSSCKASSANSNASVYFFLVSFIDADKANYSKYYDLAFDKVRSGGIILADNVLWSGKVTEANPDDETKALMAFSDKIQADVRVENVLITQRDGLMMIRKK